MLTVPWVTVSAAVAGAAVCAAPAEIERWGLCEVSLTSARAYANPFTEVELRATFSHAAKQVVAEGFYDGDGTWRVRLMPDELGQWTWRTESNDGELDGKSGRFECTAPTDGNHGPLAVRNTYHFAHADGTPYYQVGTTCYAWIHQTRELQERTLATLADAPFNKIRLCVFPKAYTYNENEPELYPYEGTPLREWDLWRPNPAFYRHLEERVLDLQRLGIEADLILFHPYDRWGFARMTDEQDDFYLRYVVARLAAFRNVWWSLANEYDLMESKDLDDWDRFFRIIEAADPYGHPRGIHNCRGFYDHTKPWVTHASIQSADFGSAIRWREEFQKPILYDECRYEGDVPQGWGNLSAQQMVDHFWRGSLAGCYVGHGETYKHPEDVLWWSKGGVLHGESPARIAFLRDIMENLPYEEMTPSFVEPAGSVVLAKPGECYLVYSPGGGELALDLPEESSFRADGIDTWAMSVEPLNDVPGGEWRFTAPTSPYAVRLIAYGAGEPRRPRAEITAEPQAGEAPLTARFNGPEGAACAWDFGDGEVAEGAAQTHTYREPGLYGVRLKVTDNRGLSSSATLNIAVDLPGDDALVRVGSPDGESHEVTLHGRAERAEDGGFLLPAGEPWSWVEVGDGPIDALEGLRSFTILGWLWVDDLAVGSGGNRIACTLNYNRAGLDLVHLADGRLRLAVNEWPDGVQADSSPGRLKVGKWIYFAVAYDSTLPGPNVRWYFGAEGVPAEPDTSVTYNVGPTGKGSGPMSAGNYNHTLHQHGLDRQLRGRLRGLRVFGSRASSRGALSLDRIREEQGAG